MLKLDRKGFGVVIKHSSSHSNLDTIYINNRIEQSARRTVWHDKAHFTVVQFGELNLADRLKFTLKLSSEDTLFGASLEDDD